MDGAQEKIGKIIHVGHAWCGGILGQVGRCRHGGEIDGRYVACECVVGLPANHQNSRFKPPLKKSSSPSMTSFAFGFNNPQFSDYQLELVSAAEDAALTKVPSEEADFEALLKPLSDMQLARLLRSLRRELVGTNTSK